MRPVPVARLCILAAFAVAAVPAFAGEKISVIASGLEAQGQLEEVFCVSQLCVPPEQVLSGGKLDGKKLDREGVKYTVSANRVKKGIAVKLTDRAGKVRYEEELDAGAGGRLSVGPLVSLAAKVIDSIENGTSQKPEKNLAAMRAWAAKQKLAKSHKAGKKKFAARGNKRSGRG